MKNLGQRADKAETITDYIWFEVLHHAPNYEAMVLQPNGDYRYREEAQDIFNNIMDILEV